MMKPPTIRRSRTNGSALAITPLASRAAEAGTSMTDQPTSPPAPENADPSMEEILASIRRILNDDDASAPPPVSTAAAEPAAEDDVLMLDDSMMVSPHEPRQHDAETAENISEAEAAEPMVRDALTTAPTEGEWPGHE